MYEHLGQAFAFSTTGIVMALLVTVGCVLAGKKWLQKPLPALVVSGRA